MKLSPELKMIVGDRVQLQQVILNLILNSAAAMRNSQPGSTENHNENRNGGQHERKDPS